MDGQIAFSQNDYDNRKQVVFVPVQRVLLSLEVTFLFIILVFTNCQTIKFIKVLKLIHFVHPSFKLLYSQFQESFLIISIFMQVLFCDANCIFN